jgi:hypothetical protein
MGIFLSRDIVGLGNMRASKLHCSAILPKNIARVNQPLHFRLIESFDKKLLSLLRISRWNFVQNSTNSMAKAGQKNDPITNFLYLQTLFFLSKAAITNFKYLQTIFFLSKFSITNSFILAMISLR